MSGEESFPALPYIRVLEYLHCCSSGRVDARGEVTLDGRSLPKVDKFKYLGSIIQQNEDIDEDIN